MCSAINAYPPPKKRKKYDKASKSKTFQHPSEGKKNPGPSTKYFRKRKMIFSKKKKVSDQPSCDGQVVKAAALVYRKHQGRRPRPCLGCGSKKDFPTRTPKWVWHHGCMVSCVYGACTYDALYVRRHD